MELNKVEHESEAQYLLDDGRLPNLYSLLLSPTRSCATS